MAPVSGGGPVALSPLFAGYRLDSGFDEMFDLDGREELQRHHHPQHQQQ
jgi:hypothetical protein